MLAVSILVGQKRTQILVKQCLVYAQVFAHVLWKQDPLLCMVLLFPVCIATENIFVGTLKAVAVNPVVLRQRAGRPDRDNPMHNTP